MKPDPALKAKMLKLRDDAMQIARERRSDRGDDTVGPGDVDGGTGGDCIVS